MSHSIITTALASAVAPAGTFAVSYPSGKDAGNFYLAMGHKLVVGSDSYFFPVDFDVTLGTSTITITNKTSAITWPQGATVRLQMEEIGERSQLDTPLQSPNAMTGTISGSVYNIDAKSKLLASATDCYLDLLTLGAPIALDDDGICAAQSLASSGALNMNGALVSSGVATLDVPRAVQVVSSGADTAVITVTGTDVYGQSMSEAITLNGTTAVNGKKAFKRITAVSAGAAIANLAKVGTTDILGLPVFVPDAGFLIAELQNGKKIGDAAELIVPFQINQTDLLAGTAQNFVSPVNGFVQRASVIVTSAINASGGGPITFQVGTTDITGLSVTVADGAAVGTVYNDTPTTPYSATTVVSAGSRLQVTPGASFATSGAVNGFIGIVGTAGTFVAGIRTGGGSTTTTGDVRGTWKPPTACDGSTVWQLAVVVPDRYPGIRQNLG